MSTPSPTQPNLTLYFLQSSRSIRIAFLLEELNLPYTSVFFPRINQKVPGDFKRRSGSSLGKAPVLRDGGKGDEGGMVVLESGGITEFVSLFFFFLSLFYSPFLLLSSFCWFNFDSSGSGIKRGEEYRMR